MDAETLTVTESRPRSGTRFGFIATSAVASAVGVVVAAFTDLLGLAVTGALGGREPVLYHNDVAFRAGGSDLALGGGVVLSLVVGAFFLLLYPGSRRYDAARLTTLWVILHCFRQGFTQMVAVPLDADSNAALAFSALDVPPGLDLVIATAGAVGLLSIALASAPAFLAFAPTQREIASGSRRAGFTAKLALIPGVVGPLLAVPVFLPDPGNGLIQSLPFVGAFTTATVIAAVGTRSVTIGDYRDAPGWSWLPLAWLVVLGLIAQFLLARGILIPPSLDQVFTESS